MKTFLPLVLTLFIIALETEACCKNKSIGKCCGNGPCNIFCCNCDHGCNKQCETDWDSYIATISSGATVAGTVAMLAAGRKKRDVQEYFTTVDSNSDGMISLGEARSYLADHEVVKRDVSGGTRPAWFVEIDSNGDGFISPAEFDHNLA